MLLPIEIIYDEYAKWAPSGDNMQPHRIEVCNAYSCIIRGFDTRENVVYDLEGNVSKISLGCLIENFAIAANSLGYDFNCKLISNQYGQSPKSTLYRQNPSIKIDISPSKQSQIAQLFPYIRLRTVQRRRMSTRQITDEAKRLLNNSISSTYRVVWLEGFQMRLRVAKLMYQNSTTRLCMKEGYDVHSKIIEFTSMDKDNSVQKDSNAIFSKDKLPAHSLGLDPISLYLTKWAMKSWSRFHFIEKYCFGTVWAKLLMDFFTAYKCGAHFVILADKPPSSIQDYINIGRSVQRFWLQATQLQLGFQPEYSPIIFSEYLRNNIIFSKNQYALDHANTVNNEFERLIGKEQAKKAVFMGRIGHASLPISRAVRLSLDELRYNTN